MTQARRAAGGSPLRKIRLELARSRHMAEGSPLDAYEFVAPLNEDDHIDLEAWREKRALCFVHRIEGGRIAERGLLVHRAGGAGGATWAFDYEPGGSTDEEAGYRFGAHAFTQGEYVSIRDEDGETRTYRIAAVTPA